LQAAAQTLNTELSRYKNLAEPALCGAAADKLGSRWRREEVAEGDRLSSARAACSSGRALGGQRGAGSLTLEEMFCAVDSVPAALLELGKAGGAEDAAPPAIASIIRFCSAACGVDAAGITATEKERRQLKAYSMVCSALSTIVSAEGEDASFTTPLGYMLQWHMDNASGGSEFACSLLEFFGPGVPSFGALRAFAARAIAQLRSRGRALIDRDTSVIFIVDQFGKYKVKTARAGLEQDESMKAAVQNGIKTLVAALTVREARADGQIVNGHLYERDSINCPMNYPLWSKVAEDKPNFVQELTTLSPTARRVDGEAASEVEIRDLIVVGQLRDTFTDICIGVFGQDVLKGKEQAGSAVGLTAGHVVDWGNEQARGATASCRFHGMHAPLCIRWNPL